MLQEVVSIVMLICLLYKPAKPPANLRRSGRGAGEGGLKRRWTTRSISLARFVEWRARRTEPRSSEEQLEEVWAGGWPTRARLGALTHPTSGFIYLGRGGLFILPSGGNK